MKHKFVLSVTIGLLTISALATSPAHAITDKEGLVAQSFLDWQIAWQKQPDYDKAKYAWVAKAQSVPQWTFDDATLRQQKAQIDREFASQDGRTIVDRYQALASSDPSVTTRYAYGYAAWKRYQQTLNWHDTTDAIALMANSYVPSYQYTRLLLLFPTQSANFPKIFELLIQRVYKRNPKDYQVEGRLTEVLASLPTRAARAQAEPLLRSRTKRFPKDITAWYKLGYFYDQWWRWNAWLIDNAKTPQVSAQARKAALRDANAALSAYAHATAVAAPNGIWIQSSRAKYVNRILKWKQTGKL